MRSIGYCTRSSDESRGGKAPYSEIGQYQFQTMEEVIKKINVESISPSSSKCAFDRIREMIASFCAANRLLASRFCHGEPHSSKYHTNVELFSGLHRATDAVLIDGSSTSLVGQAEAAGAKTLMLTGSSDRMVDFEAAGQPYLSKPCPPDLFLRRMREIL
jgi:hypothetical protein